MADCDPTKEDQCFYYYYEMETLSPLKQMLLSFYFIIQTISTVGYGDVNPKSNNEMLFDIFVMLNGVIIFSYSVSALSNVSILTQDFHGQKLQNLRTLRRARHRVGRPGVQPQNSEKTRIHQSVSHLPPNRPKRVPPVS